MTAEAFRAPRKHNDNVIVFGVAFGQIVTFGALFHSFSLFVAPMQAELGWSATQITLAFTLGLFCADLFGIPVGHWVDRYGGRLAMTLGSTLAAVLLVAWSQVDTLWSFYAIWVAIGFAQSLCLNNVAAAALTANVRDFRRALTWVAILSGLSSVAVVPLASLAVSLLGWRNGLIALAVAQVVGPSLVYLIVLRGAVGSRTAEFARRQTALAEGRLPSAPMGGASPLRSALRTRQFWLLAIACSVHWFVITSILIHFLPLMAERGVAHDVAVMVFAFGGPAAVAGRLALHLIDPGASARKTGNIAFPLFAAGLLILIWQAPPGLWGLALYALVYGGAAGVIMIVRQTAIVELFGTRGYGAIVGALTTVCILPRTMAPVTVAVMRDGFGSYEPVLWILFGLVVAGGVAFRLAMGGGASRA